MMCSTYETKKLIGLVVEEFEFLVTIPLQSLALERNMP